MTQTEPAPTVRDRFLKLIERLIETLELKPKIDIRDQIAALALIDRVLARNHSDQANSGSAVRKYAAAFQTSDRAQRRAADADTASSQDQHQADDDVELKPLSGNGVESGH